MLAAGILWTITFIPYLKAIECEEPSRVALLLQTMSVFSLILAYFVLGESLVIGQALAFLIILFGGALVSIKNLGGKWRLSKALWFMLAATLFWSLSDVFFKLSSYNFTSFIHAFAWFTLGGFFTAPIISLLPSTRKEIFSIKFSKIPLRGWIFEFTSALLGIAGSLSFAYALTLGKVALTSVLTQAQPLFAFLLTILLSQFLKEVEKEDLRLKSVLLKTASFAVITLGLVCLYFDEFVK
jgi:drug/metabolite transporter (DMT)-like permease